MAMPSISQWGPGPVCRNDVLVPLTGASTSEIRRRERWSLFRGLTPALQTANAPTCQWLVTFLNAVRVVFVDIDAVPAMASRADTLRLFPGLLHPSIQTESQVRTRFMCAPV